MAKTVMIGIPAADAKVGILTLTSINYALMEAKSQGWNVKFSIKGNDSILPRARNVILSRFYESDATDLLFWDADISCAPGDFLKIMSWDLPFVSGAYPARAEKDIFLMKGLDGAEVDMNTGLVECEAVGTGFMRIRRDMIERMIEAEPDEWATDETATDLKRVYWLMNFTLNKKRRLIVGEDFGFCQKWRNLGGKVMVDTNLTLSHSGSKLYTGNLFERMKREQEMEAEREHRYNEWLGKP